MPTDDKRRASQTHDGQANPITSTVFPGKRALDVSPMLSPATPLQVQAQQQITRGEVNTIVLTPAALSAFVGTGDEMFDKNPTTELVYDGVAYPAAIDVMFNNPILIARIGLRGGTNPVRGLTIGVIGIDGVVTNVLVRAPGASDDGCDTGNFTPIMASGVTVTLLDIAANAQSISEMVILKCIEVKANVIANVNVDNTPDEPLFVQEQGQVVNEEATVDLTGGVWVGAPTSLLDKNVLTGVTGTGPIVITLNSPLLVSRLSIYGILVNVTVDVTTIDGTLLTKTPVPVSSTNGWDSGNFTPLVITNVIITALGVPASDIMEVGIYKTKEVKANIEAEVFVEAPPEDPIHVQAQQVIVAEEINIAGSSWTGTDVEGNIADLFDHNAAVGIEDKNGDGILVLNLNSPLLISRIGAVRLPFPSPGLTGMIFEVQKLDGTWVAVLDYMNTGGFSGPDLTEYEGLDSGNFKDVRAIGPNRGGPLASPILAKAIRVSSGAVIPWSMGEMTILKTIETKAFVYNEPAEPIFVEAEQQIVVDELDLANSALLPTAEFDSQAIERLFNKNLTSGDITYTFNIILGPGAVYATLKHPKLISRVSMAVGGTLFGTLPITISVMDIVGVEHLVYSAVPTGVEQGIDSGNFEPIMARMVTITLSDDNAILQEITILKAVETKTALNLNPVAPVEIINDPAVLNGAPSVSLPVEVGKDQNLAINVEVEITADAGITAIDANMNWYYSDDGVTFYYFATTILNDTAGALATGNPNPTGFMVAGGTSRRQIAHPLTAYNRYIQVDVSNDDAVNPIAVIVRMVRQR